MVCSTLTGPLTSFQSTPPHGERLFEPLTYEQRSQVSIHAPARGATRQNSSDNADGRMFQSTPPHGERLDWQVPPRIPGWSSFNPRPRTGSDIAVEAGHVAVYVSIHAPARGATANFLVPRVP